MNRDDLTALRRAAEDAQGAFNRHHAPFVDLVASPVRILGLLDHVQADAAEIARLSAALAEKQAEIDTWVHTNAVDELRRRAERAESAMAETRAQLEEERARNAAAQALPKVVGYISKTGHGIYFRETITPFLAELEWCGTPMWRAVAFVDAAPPLPVIPGAKP